MVGEEVGYATPFRLHGVAFNNTSSPLSYVLHYRLEQPCGNSSQAGYPRVLGFWIFPVLETPLGVPLSTSLPVVLHGMRGYLEHARSPQSPSLLCDCLHLSEHQIPASSASTTCTNNHHSPALAEELLKISPSFRRQRMKLPRINSYLSLRCHSGSSQTACRELHR